MAPFSQNVHHRNPLPYIIMTLRVINVRTPLSRHQKASSPTVVVLFLTLFSVNKDMIA